MVGNSTGNILGVLDLEGNGKVNLLCHKVQEIQHLDLSADVHRSRQMAFTYWLYKPPTTTKLKPTKMATPGGGHHHTVWGFSHLLEWQCFGSGNLLQVSVYDSVVEKLGLPGRLQPG